MAERFFPEIKIKDPREELSLSDSFGIGAELKVGYNFSTPISEGSGLRIGAALDFEFADTFDRSNLIELQFMQSYSKGNSSAAKSSHWGLQFGGGSKGAIGRIFGDSGQLAFSLKNESLSLIGLGHSDINAAMIGEESTKYTMDIGTEVGLTSEINLGGRWRMNLGLSGYYGIIFGGHTSEYNRLSLNTMFNMGFDHGPHSLKTKGNFETNLSIGEELLGFYSLAQGMVFRYAMNNTLSDGQQRLAEYGLIGEEGSSQGPLATVPYFMMAASLLGGFSDPVADHLRSKAFWGYFTGYLLRGGGSLFLYGDASASGGIGDFLTAARMGAYAAAGISSVESRRSLTQDQILFREEIVDLAAFGLNFLLAGVGEGVSYSPLTSAGAGSNISLVISPGRVSKVVRSRSISAGYAVKDKRAALVLHNDFRSLPLFTSLAVMLGGTDKSQEIHTSMGPQYRHKYFRVYGGLDTVIRFGKDAGARVGVAGGGDVIIPLWKDREDSPGISFGPKAFSDFTGNWDLLITGGTTF
ncbi:MAG: hypothetical protein BWY40_01369 [bacterium ADurb.Bin270]|nr:MAG: hypothetical protein BWY40_01369 [bacterium ADurb.Bin270]